MNFKIPSRIEDERLKAWSDLARMDLWSQNELSQICCGRVPGEPNRTEIDQIEINSALETIARGTLSRALSFVSHDDADSAARMYNAHRHYVPEIAAKWAATKFDTFPVALLEAIEARSSLPKAEVDERKSAKLRGDREQNLLRVIAGLWELSDLPREQTSAAEKITMLFDAWKWDKPAKGTIADTILKVAASLPGAAILKSDKKT